KPQNLKRRGSALPTAGDRACRTCPKTKRQKTHAQKTSMGHPKRPNVKQRRTSACARRGPIMVGALQRQRVHRLKPVPQQSGVEPPRSKKAKTPRSQDEHGAPARRTPKKAKNPRSQTSMGHPQRPTMGDARDNARERRRRRQSGVEPPHSKKAKNPRSEDEHGAPAKTKDRGTAGSSHGWNAAGSE